MDVLSDRRRRWPRPFAIIAERVAAGTLWHDHRLLFAQVNGRPTDPRRRPPRKGEMLTVHT